MSTVAQKICLEALSLPRESRIELAERILSSLEDKADRNAERSWKAVVRRRRGEIHAGKAKVRPAEDVMADAWRSIS